jgi:uncharacterized protein (DUF305 family)
MNKRTLALIAAIPVTAVILAACGSTSSTNPGASMPMAAQSTNSAMMHNAGDVTFAQAMIPQHQQAVQMAKLAATRASDSRVKDLAARIEAAQGPEVTMMTGWMSSWGASMPSDMAGMDMPGLMSVTDMAALNAASGTAFDKAFLTMMIAHHTGALAMAKTELASGSDADAKALAQSIIDGQTKEITEMKMILGIG